MAESSRLLSTHKFQLAIPATIQALKYSKDVDGESSLAVVEPYLHLAHASLGLQQLSQAEDHLSFARWIVLNNSAECSNRTRARLHQLMGRGLMAKGGFEEAKREFADCIFYCSRHHGAESIPTSIGYFRLGDVFLAQGNVENALAFFDKFVDIWYKYLSNLHSSHDIDMSKTRKISYTDVAGKNDGFAASEEEPASISEEDLTDGYEQLSQILENRRRLLGSNHIATGEAEYTMGLFEFFLLKNDIAAEDFVTTAQKTYQAQLGNSHPSTAHVASVLAMIHQSIIQKQQAMAAGNLPN